VGLAGADDAGAVDTPALRGDEVMDNELILRNNLAVIRKEKKLSQAELAKLVGVSRNTISSIETGQFNPTAKLALILCIALDKKFEDIFYF
jgi:putative transcriptional regulator